MSDPFDELDHSPYQCPGESYRITRSIHLARLAAFYPNCRDCPHRFESGQSLPSPVPAEGNGGLSGRTHSLIVGGGIRGTYLNQIDHNRACRWGEALAAFLWHKRPWEVCALPADPAEIIAQPVSGSQQVSRQPVVVIGFDERPSSPDIIRGAVLGLRRMGCSVLDLSQTTLPVVAFHLHAQHADAALFVTGAGCDPSWTGFEFLLEGGIPIPDQSLHELERLTQNGVSRQSRGTGTHRTLPQTPDYERELSVAYHALRPLRLVCGDSTRSLSRALDRLLAQLPCRVTHVALPVRRRDLADAHDPDLQRVAAAVIEGQCHLGVVMDESRQRCAFVTDRGRLVSPVEVARLITEVALRGEPGVRIAVGPTWREPIQQWVRERDAELIATGDSPTEVATAIQHAGAALGFSSDGQIWFRGRYPTSDALLILAHTLQALSFSDAPFSDVISRIRATMSGVS